MASPDRSKATWLPLTHRALERQDVVLRCFAPPEFDQFFELLRVVSGNIVALCGIFVQVEQLPTLSKVAAVGNSIERSVGGSERVNNPPENAMPPLIQPAYVSKATASTRTQV